VNREAEAAETYETLLEMDPQNATLWNNQAWYFAQAGVELDRALAAIERAVTLAPGTAIFEDTFAWVLHVRGEHERAAEWIERALASATGGGSAGMWENAGDIYAAAGRRADAEHAWEKAMEKGGDRERLQAKIAAES
jgi:Tfp pilus assembly protein PilF